MAAQGAPQPPLAPCEISCCTQPWCNWPFPSHLTSGSYWKVRFFSGPAKLLESIVCSYWGLWCQTPTDCGLSGCQKGVTLAALSNWGSVSTTHTTNCLDMARAFGRESSTKATRSSACCNKNSAPTPSQVPATPATQSNALIDAWLRLQEIPPVTSLFCPHGEHMDHKLGDPVWSKVDQTPHLQLTLHFLLPFLQLHLCNFTQQSDPLQEGVLQSLVS